jgi:hypothetical protein
MALAPLIMTLWHPRRAMAGKDRTNTYILLLAIVVAVVAGYYLPTRHPETGASMTPRDHIDHAEQKKAQRLRYTEEQQDAEASDALSADGATSMRP